MSSYPKGIIRQVIYPREGLSVERLAEMTYGATAFCGPSVVSMVTVGHFMGSIPSQSKQIAFYRIGCHTPTWTTPRALKSIPEQKKCERQELNLHGFPHWILRPAIPSYKAKTHKDFGEALLHGVPPVVPSKTVSICASLHSDSSALAIWFTGLQPVAL